MANKFLSNINLTAGLEADGSAGTSGQILKTTGSGVEWVNASTVIGGLYLPLSAGSSYPLTGALHFGDDYNYIEKNSSSDMLVVANRHITFSDVISGVVNERMRIEEGGNVGIGTTNPTAAKLVVDSDTAPQILVKNSGGGNAQILFEDNSGGTQNASITYDQSGQNALYITTEYDSPTDGNRIYLQPGGETAMTLRGGSDASGQAGFVGIGTTSPSERLEVNGNIKIQSALLSNQENTDIDTGSGVVAQVAISYTAAFFDFVVKKGTNIRSGTVYACHDGTNVEFTETSTQDLGDTSDVVLSVDKTSTNLRLIATVASDDWIVKSLVKAI